MKQIKGLKVEFVWLITFFNVRGMIFLFKGVLRIKERLAESKMK